MYRLIDAHGEETLVSYVTDELLEECATRGVTVWGPFCSTCGHLLDDRSGLSCHTWEAFYGRTPMQQL